MGSESRVLGGDRKKAKKTQCSQLTNSLTLKTCNCRDTVGAFSQFNRNKVTALKLLSFCNFNRYSITDTIRDIARPQKTFSLLFPLSFN